ncbi:MAG: hypothetical protein GY730_02955 [bacterium]|nr:hypothetical protein [bacterium]
MIFKIIACNSNLLTGIQNKLNKNRIIDDSDIYLKSTGRIQALSHLDLSTGIKISAPDQGMAVVLFLKSGNKTTVLKILYPRHYSELTGLKIAKQLGFSTPEFISLNASSKSGAKLLAKIAGLSREAIDPGSVKDKINKVNNIYRGSQGNRI